MVNLCNFISTSAITISWYTGALFITLLSPLQSGWPSEWERFVDDCIIVYEHSDRDFDKFLGILNSLDDHIKFTCERSKPGVECGFSGEVVEAIPFLDFMVMRYLDPQSNVLSNKICIYRKPCHKGSYIHAYSSQPILLRELP